MLYTDNKKKDDKTVHKWWEQPHCDHCITLDCPVNVIFTLVRVFYVCYIQNKSYHVATEWTVSLLNNIVRKGGCYEKGEKVWE